MTDDRRNDENVFTHRHAKTGGLYKLIGYGLHTETNEPVAIYYGATGLLWARPRTMFDDGRFVPLEKEKP